MEFKKVVNISSDKFFENILYLIVQDIKISTNCEVDISKIIEGYNYKKSLSKKNIEVKVTITKITKASLYEAKIENIQGATYSKYEILSINENKAEIIYSERFEGSNKSNTLNYKIMTMFLKRSFRKKADTILSIIENFTISKL